jgi:D-alanyl-D-alanine carboxypeptidase
MNRLEIKNPQTIHHKLNELLNGLVSRKKVHHAIIGLESGDRKFKWIGAKGEARTGVPMLGQTPFMIASITKLYIAAAILKLYEKKVLDLSDPISSHLPASFTDGLHRFKYTDYSGQITIRHLLSHTSGLPDWLEDRPEKGKSLLETIEEQEDRLISVEETVEFVRKNLKPHFPPQPPGAKKPMVRYSDTNFQLLIAIIEQATEKPIHQAFEELIYWQLGLQNTWHAGHPTSEYVDRPADIWTDDKVISKPLLLQSFRDLYSTADELLAFMKGLNRGLIFENKSTASLMMEQWNRFGFPRDLAALRQPGWPIEYGLGMMRFKMPRIFTPFKPVPAVVGHTGVSGSWLFYCAELDLYLCGTVDQTAEAPLPFRFLPKLLKIFESEEG